MYARLILIILYLSITACAARGFSSECFESEKSRDFKLYVVSHGWHTGIVVRISDIPSALIPEIAYFSNSAFLEFGWGDASYYQKESPSVITAIEAAFASKNSVLHVAGLSREPQYAFYGSEIIEITLSEPELNNILSFISATFSRPNQEKASSIGRGWYGEAHFFHAKGDFSLKYNCNSWTAEALSRGTCLFHDSLPKRSSSLMRKLKEYASYQD